jgi:hypothetical protein
MRRRDILTVLTGAAVCRPGLARAADQLRRIAVLTEGSESDNRPVL